MRPMTNTQPVVVAESGCPDLLTPPAQEVFIQPVLLERNSGLCRVVLTPAREMVSRTGALNQEHSAAAWMHRCAKAANVHPYYTALHCQREQGLVKDSRAYDPSYKVTVIFGGRSAATEGMRVIPTIPLQGEERWVLASGEWKMMAACGVGIMDPGAPAWVATEKYLGFDRQIWGCATSGASVLRRWNKGERMLTDRRVKAGTTIGGTTYQEDVLVTAECRDIMAFAALVHTPHWHSLESVRSIASAAGVA